MESIHPQALVDTVFFLCGLHLALKSGNEHQNLQTTQFKITSSLDGSPQLEYTENFSKIMPVDSLIENSSQSKLLITPTQQILVISVIHVTSSTAF